MNPNSNNINSSGSIKLANANGGFTGSNDIKAIVVPSNPFVSFGWILFSLSAITCIGLFFYDRQLSVRSGNTLNEVINYKNGVESVDLTGIRALMDKLSTFNDLSLKHNRPTSMLNFLEVITNKNVAWSAFDYKIKDKDKYEVTLTGKALSYKYVIQQVDELQSGKYDKYIKNVSLTNLNKTQEQIKNKINPSLSLENRDIINFGIRFELVNPIRVDSFDQFIEGNVNFVNNDTNQVKEQKLLNMATSSTTTSSTTTTNAANTIIKKTNIKNK